MWAELDVVPGVSKTGGAPGNHPSPDVQWRGIHHSRGICKVMSVTTLITWAWEFTGFLYTWVIVTVLVSNKMYNTD